jgi:hypothetical protein
VRKLLFHTAFLSAVLLSFLATSAVFAKEKFETNSITPNFLVVYFHSYGGNYLEPFELPSAADSISKALLKDIPGVAILTMDRESTAALNGSDGYRAVSQLIMKYYAEHPSFKHIILCGTSLGAYESVAYLHYAPQNIFEKISGIITVEPTDDLAELYYKTRSPKVKQLIFTTFGGDPVREPEYYHSHSIKTLYSNVPDRPNVRVCVVSAKYDQVVPTSQQKRLCETLRNKKFQVKMVEINQAHSIAAAATYGKALHYVTGR